MVDRLNVGDEGLARFVGFLRDQRLHQRLARHRHKILLLLLLLRKCDIHQIGCEDLVVLLLLLLLLLMFNLPVAHLIVSVLRNDDGPGRKFRNSHHVVVHHLRSFSHQNLRGRLGLRLNKLLLLLLLNVFHLLLLLLFWRRFLYVGEHALQQHTGAVLFQDLVHHLRMVKN